MKTKAITTEESQILLEVYEKYDGQATKILVDERVKKMNKGPTHIMNHISYCLQKERMSKVGKKRPRKNEEDNLSEDLYSVVQDIIITETERHNSLMKKLKTLLDKLDPE